MKERQERQREHDLSGEFSSKEKTHPFKIIVLFALLGISTLFISLLVAFNITHPELHLTQHSFPKAFFASTLLIITGSFVINKCKRCFLEDDAEKLFLYLAIAAVIGTCFSVSQFIGWKELYSTGIFIQGSASGSFLFLLTGLHLAHLFGGMIFLLIMTFKVFLTKEDGIKALLFYSDKLEKARLESIVIYWHFLDGLWIMLFMYFLYCFIY